ncbi:pentapeptide repeat-containing protein [Lentzea sp. NPDC051838]|uniref:pentapeptide repeat-containing protein n=1 Tax=Lentzea sp. NPDC051838 TaxID=3154849 RepID=UPI003415722E
MRSRTLWLMAAGVAGGLVVLVFVPHQAQSQINLRMSLLHLFGGLVIVAAAVEAWRHAQAHRDSRITDRFGSAVERLSGENTDIRIGGLHELEQIALDSPKDRRFVQITIESFVRNRVPWTGQVDESAPDVQVALAILTRSPAALKLSRVDLRGVDLEDRQLAGSDFRGSNLRRATLRGTSLRDASLRDADLEGADLRGADLTGADLRGADMRALNLDQARLDGAHVDGKTIWPPGFARFGVSASLFSD